jgi:putative spermidine/putrescine transport system permease protein
VLPLFVVAVAAFLLLPLVVVIGVSVTSGDLVQFPPDGLSLKWFGVALENQTFVRGLINSVWVAVAATAGSFALGIPAGIGLGRTRSLVARRFEMCLLTPLTFPLIVLGPALLFFYAALGWGLSPIGLALGHVVITLPYVIRTITAVYRGLDRGLEEAALVLGASPARTLWYVTLPLLRPGIVAAGLFSLLISFDNVVVSAFLTRDDTVTLPIAMLTYVQYNFDPSLAAISVIQIALVIVVLLMVNRLYGLERIGSGVGQ